MLSHSTEELAYVLTGVGELRLDEEAVPYGAGSALFIPAGVWHAVGQHRRRARDDGLRIPPPRLPTDRPPSRRRPRSSPRDRGRPSRAGRDRVSGHRPRGLRRPDARARERPERRRADRSGSSARASRSTRSSHPTSSRSTLDDPTALERADYHLESVMHTEIYLARPDVGSVIHGHPLYGTALGSTDAQARDAHA